MLRRLSRLSTRTIIVSIAGTFGGLLALAAMIGLSGLYSVAASKGHWKPVEWLLTFGMQRSVATHALDIDEPPLHSSDLITLGAVHYDLACASCHGAPGRLPGLAATMMLPQPPDLAPAAATWRARELFWIVKHGIKYTGMPAWPTQEHDDEVWAVVAFLQTLPKLDAAGYRDLAQTAATTASPGAGSSPPQDRPDNVQRCGRCHGTNGAAPRSRLVPILDGQPHAFLAGALAAYIDGQRPSGIMRSAIDGLAEDDLARAADHYSGLPPPRRDSGAPVDNEALARGRRLAEEGDADRRIPACSSCHGAAARPDYPRLAGQNAAYMMNRLEHWQRQADGAPHAPDEIMRPIARRLSEQQSRDVALFYAAQAAASGAER